MEFNPDKCEVIRITNRRKKKIITNDSIHEHQLKEVKCAKYLGVAIDRTVSWNGHINSVTRKPTTQQYSATSTHATMPSKRYATKCLSDSSWSMRRRCGLRLQRRTSNLWRMCKDKLPASLRVTTVDAAVWLTTKIESLNWVILASRRAEAKLVMLYRIANNLVDVTASSFIAAPTRTRGNTHRYLQPSTHIEAYKHSFFPSTIKSRNQCTQQLVSQQSLGSFRRHLH